MKIFEIARLAAGMAAMLPLLLPALAWAHHGHPGQNLWHDIEYLFSSPGVVLLIAAALVGVWIVAKRRRHASGKKT